MPIPTLSRRVAALAMAFTLTAGATAAMASYQLEWRVGGLTPPPTPEELAERERQAQIRAEQAMCLEERTWSEDVTNTRLVDETRYRTEYRDETRYRTAYRTEVSWVQQFTNRYVTGSGSSTFWRQGSSSAVHGGIFVDGTRVHIFYDRSVTEIVSGSRKYVRGSLRSSQYMDYGLSLYNRVSTEVPYQESYTVQVPYEEAYTVQVEEEYQETIVHKTEQYDYCLAKGYDTAS